ncbi:hypothetical protein [Neisseria bergeri]|uniref:hypothetical protein n=1 Tax=Neisseria bergeri TaxID=1906581 RepID=UPI00142DE6D2|nr:hypothetical protein [Neisseria bergeri]
MPSEIRLVPHYSRENKKQRRKLKIPSFPRRRESGISMPQEFIGKKPKPFRRHSHESGNLEMKSNRNLSEMTETERTGFPLSRE